MLNLWIKSEEAGEMVHWMPLDVNYFEDSVSQMSRPTMSSVNSGGAILGKIHLLITHAPSHYIFFFNHQTIFCSVWVMILCIFRNIYFGFVAANYLFLFDQSPISRVDS